MKQYSAEIEIDGKKIRFRVYPNSYKTEDKHPDYIVYIDGEKAGAIWEREKEEKPRERQEPYDKHKSIISRKDKEESKLEPF